jgi:hypothetical protein
MLRMRCTGETTVTMTAKIVPDRPQGERQSDTRAAGSNAWRKALCVTLLGLMAFGLGSKARAQEGSPPSDATFPPPAPTAPQPPEHTAGPVSGGEPTPAAPVRRLLILEAGTYGIDPIVGRVVTDRMRRTGADMGYEVVDPGTAAAAAGRLRMPYPPTPADLWRVTWVAQAHRGAFARVWAAEGRYVMELMVASLDGSGPYFGRETAGAEDLREVVDRLVRATLPLPNTWQQAPIVQHVASAAPRPSRWRERPREELAHPGGIGVRLPEPPTRRWALTLQTEAVIGTTQGAFYNHLLGTRLDLHVTRDFVVGAYVGYANLQGRHDRVHNVLTLLQVEYRVRVAQAIDLALPLRAAVGYLPFNGPVIRLAAGLRYALSDDLEIGADVVAPTVWFLPNDVAASIDLAVEVTYRFP